MQRTVFPALFALALVLAPFSSPVSAQTKSDETAFKERVAACNSEGCLVNVAHLYFSLWRGSHDLAQLNPGPYRKRAELEIARMRGQLHDPDIFQMMEDGRWDAMTEAQKQDWTRKRWGPHPNDVEP